MSQTLQGAYRPYPQLDPCEIRGCAHGSTVEVVVVGEVDTSATDRLTAALTVAGAGRAVTVDLSGVTFVDARILGVVARAQQRMTSQAGTLSIRRPSRLVRRRLELVGLAGLIEAVAPGEGSASPAPPVSAGFQP